MANLPEDGIWVEGVYQLETSDSVLAGPGGVSNRQAEELGNRTRYLKTQTDSLATNKLGILDAAASADKLTLSRNISVTGAATGSVGFDGSTDVSMALTLANSGVTAGTYGSATQVPVLAVNNKGIITNVTLATITGTGGDFIPTAEKGEPNGVAPLNGLGVIPEEFLPASTALAHGQCQFVYLNTTTCRLVPYNGSGLVINGAQYNVPFAGVNLPIASVGVINGSTAYVYAYDDGAGNIALEASSTTHSKDVNTGIEIKAGDPTRTLVGAVYKTDTGQFVNSSSSAGVSSWFNRQPRSVSFSVADIAIGGSPAPLGDIISTWVWSGEKLYAQANGDMSNDGAVPDIHIYLGPDASLTNYRQITATAPANQRVPFSISAALNAVEGMATIVPKGSMVGGFARYRNVFYSLNTTS